MFIQVLVKIVSETVAVWINSKCKLKPHTCYTDAWIPIPLLYGDLFYAGRGNAARLVPELMDRGQKTARHSGWEGASRRYWEKIFIALHSTSLPLHWRNERSNKSLKLLKKLDAFTTDSLIYYAYLLSTISMSVKYKWLPLEDDRFKLLKVHSCHAPKKPTNPPPQKNQRKDKTVLAIKK